MTKAEKEKRKLDDAKKAYDEFIQGIQLIRRDIMINSTEEGELCQVISLGAEFFQKSLSIFRI